MGKALGLLNVSTIAVCSAASARARVVSGRFDWNRDGYSHRNPDGDGDTHDCRNVGGTATATVRAGHAAAYLASAPSSVV